MNKIDKIIKSAVNLPNKKVAIACPEDHEVLEAVSEARKMNLCDFILFGDLEKINNIINNYPDLDINNVKIVDIKDNEEACKRAVSAVSNKEADVLMKGLIDTAILLRHVLNKEYGLRTDKILSHTMIIDLPKLDRLIYLSDGAMLIDPTVEQLKEITINAVSLAHALGNARPKVAVISAIEKVNPKMPSSQKAYEIQQYYEKGEIKDCVVSGPLAVDIALDKEAALTKKMNNEVAGAADILIVPFIEVGNALYKGWMFGTDNVKGAGVVLGAKAPIVLTSRADSHLSKLYSIALAVTINN